MKKVVVIAGGTSGIGLAAKNIFTASDWRVATFARTQKRVSGENFIGIPVDLMDDRACKAACNNVRRKWGRIDAVIHCVGDIDIQTNIKDVELKRWLNSYAKCVGTAFSLTKWTFDSVADTSGSYVYVASVAAQKYYPGIADYCAAKAALVNFSRSVASELVPFHARANSVSPAVIDTPLFRKSPYSENEAASWHKLGRIGKADEVAKLIYYLCGQDADWITGRDFVIDGGMLL